MVYVYIILYFKTKFNPLGEKEADNCIPGSLPAKKTVPEAFASGTVSFP